MMTVMNPATTNPWPLARRAARLEPSTIREILKITERPGIVSLAGGLPAAETFPVEAMRAACETVLRDAPREALQYAASEGYGPLREWVAAELGSLGLRCDAGQVLITTGSQQGLDLIGKVLIDPGSAVAVEQPTYLGALQAFAPFEPEFVAIEGDDEGPQPEALRAAMAAPRRPRFVYLLPNFQNPTGRCMSAARRAALADAALELGLPVVEDNPYGDLWYRQAPPPPLSARLGEGAVYLGSFSKVLAPGLRLGYVVAPKALYPKLLQAKQAADLHTPGFNQRVVHEVIKSGFLKTHVPTIRARYAAQAAAMQEALAEHLPPGCRYNRPEGGMFCWVELPAGLDAAALLPQAVQAGVAYVPGAPFFAREARANTLRLSYVTVSPERIEAGVRALGSVLRAALDAGRRQAA